MNSLAFRSAALAVLLLALLSLGGLPMADAALSSAGPAGSCCFPVGHGEELPQSPCATPDCPCLFCLNLYLPGFAEVFFLPLSSAGPVSQPLTSPLAAFAPSIDYPPERA
ncbi:MAG: hypothetical protein A2512_02380 [Deltaproteobacteria bacterium RIFOXYD12_FULL_56_24]|nr:MAG: hypothetical protein A2512_02380 [Deltaproteobacteria bacterium RIFOXYD12_FULL_56_24]